MPELVPPYPEYFSSTSPTTSIPPQYQERKGIRKKNPEAEEDRARYTINLEEVLHGKDERTTLMIKNIPNKYNQKLLLKTIDETCKRQYDFFYLPIDFKVRTTIHS